MAQSIRAAWISVFALAAVSIAPVQSTWAEDAAEHAPATAPKDSLPYSHGKAADGATKAAACLACHGANGNSVNPEWPNLAGQNAVYISEQLHLFRDGIRVNPVMSPMSAALSDQDIADLSVYFATQTPAGLEADPSYWKLGQTLYRVGDSKRNIPACIACHGPVGNGNLAAGYPALRAQHAVYTVKQLNDYASGARYSGAAEGKPASRNGVMMNTVASRLTPEDIRNVASYIQGLR